LIAALMFPFDFAPANLIMVYLVGVVYVAARYARGPSVLAAVLSVLAFDFFFVPPYLTFHVADTQYVVTFAVMLLVGLTISSMTTRIKDQAEAAREREQRTTSLYEMSRDFASNSDVEILAQIAVRHIENIFDSKALLLLPDEPDLHRQTIVNISRLRGLCEKYGMPLMIEPLVMKGNDARGGYQVDGDKQKIVALVRQARELGADVIKADPTDHAEDYHEVIEAARCPVPVRGGGKADLKEVFERSYAFLQQGAHGLVYGRNIYQHPNPTRIVQAFMAMIHEDASAEEAWAMYEQG